MLEKTKFIKSCDMPKSIIINLFQMLNPKNVTIIEQQWDGFNPKAIVSKVSPAELVYPEGWYFAKGCLRNKHNSSSGLYEEIPIYKPGAEECWSNCICSEDMEQIFRL